MRILVTGAGGLIGRALQAPFKASGHELVPLSRSPAQAPGVISWDPVRGFTDASLLEGFDAVIHLAGDNISEGRWTASKKTRIRDSRVNGTAFLADAIASLSSPPQTFISASAVGYYGDRGSQWMDETSPRGTGFLSDVCQAWEDAARSAGKNGIRVATLRFGMVLSAQGGALAKMLPPFRLGLGGPVGSGTQFVSWISIDEIPPLMLHVLRRSDIAGAVNAVTPHPVTNRDLAKALSGALHRPGLLPLPSIAARLMFGEMADELLLSGARVKPAVLEKSGYRFQFPELPGALDHLLR